jgi:parvulin-like peptidyl-prolyl isomerase
MKNFITSILICIPLLTACGGKEDASTLTTSDLSDTTLAKVGRTKIKADEFSLLYNAVSANRPYALASKQAFLNELVRLELGWLEAKKEKLDQDPQIEFQLKATLTQNLLQKHLISKIRQITITDAEVQEFYERNPQIRASHILLRVKPDEEGSSEDEVKRKIDDIRKQAVSNKKSFAELAKKHSEDPTASNGGDLDYFSGGTMAPEFSNAAFSLKAVNDISVPVRTQFGWHIIQLTDKRSFKDADKDILKQALITSKRQKLVDDYFVSLEQKYKTTIYKDILNDLIEASAAASKVVTAVSSTNKAADDTGTAASGTN